MQEEKEITIYDVIDMKKRKNRRVDSKLIMKAYNLAKEKHGEQKRRSGELYIIHPLNVAYILAELGLDESTLAAAIMHDLIEDTEITEEDIKKEFGDEIAQMVLGVTKLRKNSICFNRGTTS